MTVWARALLLPSSMLRASRDELLRAVALLLEGRVDAYRTIATSLDLPTDTEPRSRTELGQFAQALLLSTDDDAAAMQQLSQLLGRQLESAEIRAVAAIVQGVLLAGVGRPDWAVRTLRAELEQPIDGLTKALLLVHLGLRSSEQGEMTEALDFTQAAQQAVSRRRGGDAYTLRLVAELNAWQIGWVAGRRVTPPSLSFHRAPLFAWIFGGSDDALTAYLNEMFTSYFEDPHTRTVKFAAEDSIDVGLGQTLRRCEFLAYRQGIVQYRQKLGRYRLLTEEGHPGPAVSSGFELLRRAGDDKGLRLVARTFRASGPLEVLRSVGLRATKASWLEPELQATLEVIGSTAFAFGSENAASAFSRLMKALPDVISRTFAGAWLVDSGFRALAGLLPLLREAETATASKWLRSVAEGEASTLIHHSMPTALHALRWEHLDEQERAAWFQFVERHLLGRDDRLFPARSAVLELASVDSPRALATIYTAYREGQLQWLAPLVVGREDLKESDRRRIVEDLLRAASAIRDQAHGGEFRLGGPHIGNLLASAAIQFGESALFVELGRFIGDGQLPLDERMAAALVLLEQPGSVPTQLRRRLAKGLAGPTIDMPLLGDPGPLELVNLRLRAAFGRLSSSDAIPILLRYANDRRPQLRTSAAVAAGTLAASAQVPIGTLLLSLSHDPVPEVRGAAGRWLSRIEMRSGVLDKARLARVSELLQEPGELVPLQVWMGLAQFVRAGGTLDREIRQLAEEVATHHIAHTVREAASAVVDH